MRGHGAIARVATTHLERADVGVVGHLPVGEAVAIAVLAATTQAHGGAPLGVVAVAVDAALVFWMKLMQISMSMVVPTGTR